MKISITITKKSPVHINFQVFVNGALSGSLVLRNEEFRPFMAVLQPDIIRDNLNNIVKKCESDGMTYTSIPPQLRCKNCRQFWFAYNPEPDCTPVGMSSLNPIN